MNKSGYNDEHAITDYVLRHYAELATSEERLVLKAISARQKAEGVQMPILARMLREKWGQSANNKINEALTNGVDAYRSSLASRLLRDNPDTIHLNRCPGCMRLVRTPAAQQCLWCGEDWHENVI